MLVARTTAISPPRVFSVLAAAALLATVLPGAASASAVPSYVALGDSYTSGPLIPDQTGNPAGCLRSTHDYPALVAAALGAASFSNVSCAGATTADMTGPQHVTFVNTYTDSIGHDFCQRAGLKWAEGLVPAARCLAASRCRPARASHQSWPACP